jgi:hypothetical protein
MSLVEEVEVEEEDEEDEERKRRGNVCREEVALKTETFESDVKERNPFTENRFDRGRD